MTQDKALLILKTGANVFLTGEPGAGKTYTINKYVAYLREHAVDYAVTASTGIAATHIGGMTIHSWSGIGIKTKLDKYELDKIATSEYVSKRINKTRVLIIDEISMLAPNMLDMLDMVCREVKQNIEPFGGLQVVLVGDFFQLPPITKRDFTEDIQSSLIDDKRNTGVFAYNAGAWDRAKPIACYLSEQHRQDDKEFLSVLNAIRRNDVTEEHLNYITSRQIVEDDMPENVTKLFSHNFDVDRVNYGELARIQNESRSYIMTHDGKEAIVATLKKGCLSPENLELKVGAVVMCTKNNPKEHFANGTLGKVIGFEEFTRYPIIQTRNGRNITITPMDWSIEENGKIRAKISQVPLRLAWAITVHKSQGMSLDGAVMDLSQVFEYGQGYVALSRVRRLSGLYLLGLNDRALKVHPEILEKDIEFKKESENAVETFAKLSPDEIKEMHKNFVTALGGKWREGKTVDKKTKKPAGTEGGGKLEQIRTKHQNAYKKWTPEEEADVVASYKAGKSIKEIAKNSGRQVGGIRARLIKVGLIEE